MGASEAIMYKNIEIEPFAPRDANDKLIMAFDESCEDLIRRGYERHLYPWEMLGFLIGGLEGRLSPEQQKTHRDMLWSWWEWMDASFERKGNRLYVHIGQKNLKWNGTMYVVEGNGLCRDKELSFYVNVKGIPSGKLVGLESFPEEFQRKMYTRKFSDLPKIMREGKYVPQIRLPHKEVVWPVIRGDYVSRCSINIYYKNGGSRGARRKK